MKARGGDIVASGAAAGAVVVSAVIAQRVCPGSCVACGSCVASIAPMAGAAVVIGAAAFASVFTRRSRRPASDPPGE